MLNVIHTMKVINKKRQIVLDQIDAENLKMHASPYIHPDKPIIGEYRKYQERLKRNSRNRAILGILLLLTLVLI